LAEARKFQQDANRAQGDKLRFSADIAARTIQYGKTTGKGAGAGPKYQEQILQNNIDYFRSTLKPKPNETPEAFDARVRKTASDETATRLKTSFSTGEIGGLNASTRLAPVESRENIAANEALTKYKLMNAREWKKSVETAGSVEAAEAKFKKNYVTVNPQAAEAAPAPAPKPTTPKPAATASKVISMADVDATVTSSGRTRQEVMDALKDKGYTVK